MDETHVTQSSAAYRIVTRKPVIGPLIRPDIIPSVDAHHSLSGALLYQADQDEKPHGAGHPTTRPLL